MNEVLKVVLSLSLSGSLLILLLFLLRPLCKGRVSKRWQYYIWLLAAARLLLPFAPEANLMTMLFQEIGRTPEQTAVVSPYTQHNAAGDPAQTNEVPDGQRDLSREGSGTADLLPLPVKNIAAAVWRNLWLVWLMGALILFIRKLTIYQNFVQYLRAGCTEASDIGLLEHFGKLAERSQVNTAVELYTNPLISSPLLIGFFHPCIVLPSIQLSPADLDHTILHELIHCKRRDMFYKWLVQFTVCVHWFNPLVSLMRREISRLCELSCDEAVMQKLDPQERLSYGDTLLNAAGRGGSYKDPLVSITLYESKELLKERLDAIMNFKKNTKWGVFLSALLTLVLICGFAFSGAYAANRPPQTDPDAGTDIISLHTNSAELLDFQQGEQATVKEAAVKITEDHVKIQFNVSAEGDSPRTLEIIDPTGEVVRSYTFHQDGFLSGDQEYLYYEDDMIMVTDIASPGTWRVRLSTDQTPAEAASVTAKLVDPFVWGFASDPAPGETEDEAEEEDPSLSDQVYDHYRSYAQTKDDIQHGYIVNTEASFSQPAMPTVTGGGGTNFYVHHDNRINISIMLKHLVDGTGRLWTPDSFVSFEVYDPSGKTAYSFYREGSEIERAVDINTELAVYPGEWQYKLSFAYTTNGIDPSDMKVSLQYQNIYQDDIQWLIDNKLNAAAFPVPPRSET